MENEVQPITQPVQPLSQTPAPTPIPTPPPSNTFKIIIFVVLGLLFLVGAVYAGIQIGKGQTSSRQPVVTQPTTSPTQIAVNPTDIPVTPSPSIDPTADWLVYEDEINKEFSFKYPSSWYNRPREIAPNGGFVDGKSFYNSKDINKENVVMLSINRGIWYEDPSLSRNTLVFKSKIGTLDTNGDTLIKVSDLKISGKSAVHYTDEYFEGGQEPPGFESIYAIKIDNWVYQFNFYSSSKESVINEAEAINGIISTLKFTN